MLKKIKIKLEVLSVKHKTVNNIRTNKAQLLEELGCRAEDLSLIFRTPQGGRREQMLLLPKIVLLISHVHCVPKHTINFNK